MVGLVRGKMLNFQTDDDNACKQSSVDATASEAHWGNPVKKNQAIADCLLTKPFILQLDSNSLSQKIVFFPCLRKLLRCRLCSDNINSGCIIEQFNGSFQLTAVIGWLQLAQRGAISVSKQRSQYLCPFSSTKPISNNLRPHCLFEHTKWLGQYASPLVKIYAPL